MSYMSTYGSACGHLYVLSSMRQLPERLPFDFLRRLGKMTHHTDAVTKRLSRKRQVRRWTQVIEKTVTNHTYLYLRMHKLKDVCSCERRSEQ